jgi:hypothetical protein
LGRIGESDRQFVAAARRVTGNQEIDRHVELGIVHPARTGRPLDPTETEARRLEAGEALGGDQHVDVGGHAFMAMHA